MGDQLTEHALDTATAEAQGWTRELISEPDGTRQRYWCVRLKDGVLSIRRHVDLWNPENNIADAWILMQELKQKDFEHPDRNRWVSFVWALKGSEGGIHRLMEELTPEDICQAYLRVNGWEYVVDNEHPDNAGKWEKL